MPHSPSTLDSHRPLTQPSSTYPSTPLAHHDSSLTSLALEPDQLPGADLRNPRAKRTKGKAQVITLDWCSKPERDRRSGARGSWEEGELTDESEEDDEDEEAGLTAVEHSSPLLDLPSDPLLHLLSFLPPSSLLNVLLVCKHLNAAASDEVAWRRLFEFNFLSGDVNAGGIMRTCQVAGGAGKGWKKEAVSRERFLYRMAHSRSPSLLHDPRLAHVHSFALSYPLPPPGTPAHQIRGPSMLSASLVYGICSRSDPATGKVVKGYVDSLGSTDQQALFNPNHLFSPVSAILLEPLDPSIVLWGFQDGHVQLTNLVVGGGRTPSRSLRSAPVDGHEGSVWCLAGGAGGFLSGGVDGRVKLWMGGAGEKREERMKLLWTGERTKEENGREGTVKPKGIAVVKVCWDASSGTAVGVTESGEVRLWTGLGADGDVGTTARTAKRHATWRDEGVDNGSSQQSFGVALALDAVSSSKKGRPVVNILVHLVGRPSFFKVVFDFSASTHSAITTTIFSSSSFSPSSADLTTIHPEFIVPPSPSLPLSSSVPTPSILSPSLSPLPSIPNVFHLPTPPTVEERVKTRGALGQSKFVVAGDSDGWVRVWDWDASSSVGGVVEPLREWRGGDNKITALSCSSGLVLAGTISGILNVYDFLTLPPILLRSFSERAASRHSVRNLAAGALDPDLWRVSQVVLDRDLIVASVGSKILSWRIGKSGSANIGNSPWSGKVIGRRAAGGGSGGGGAGKGRGAQSHHEIHSEIVAAQRSHQAQQRATHAAMERDRAKVDRFTGGLDLTEEERVAYVLMLSRDEEERRLTGRRNSGSPAIRQRSVSSSVSGRQPAPEEDDDDQLRLALEASLLDEDPSPGHVEEEEEEEEEELEVEYFEEDDDDSYEHSNASSYTPDSPLRQPSSSSAYFSTQPLPRYSRLSPLSSPILAATRDQSSVTPSPTFGSLDDQTSWPAMGLPVVSGKGKMVATSKPENVGPPPKMDWSKLAIASASSGGRGAKVHQEQPKQRAMLTREEREEEELQLVLEMSLLDS